ncbi:transposase [Pseudonocardia halophobica]|uniref:transposase n=1 Tax=Pseudonocardia halophobica TaxID=29401 RepID=UPI003D8B4E4D
MPTETEEAARDLVRAREDARGDLMRARHRLSELLLRHGLVWDHSAWTGAHDAWLRSLHFDRTGVQLAFDEAYEAVLSTQARRDRLDRAIEAMAAEPAFAPAVGRLCCLRGVATSTGFGLAVEIGTGAGSPARRSGPTSGLVPSESSTGTRRVQGGITKTGNSHARRLLIEAAWHHRKRYRPSRELLRRRAHQPPAVWARADQGNRRLHRRWARLDARHKRPTVSAVAVARELAGWCWSLAVLDDPDHAATRLG